LRRRISLSIPHQPVLIGFPAGYVPVIVLTSTYGSATGDIVVVERPGGGFFSASISFQLASNCSGMKCRSSSDGHGSLVLMRKAGSGYVFLRDRLIALSAWRYGPFVKSPGKKFARSVRGDLADAVSKNRF